MAPRVSVIIPAHNAERYLPQALSSVQDQTIADWEVVVCDDVSTDGTADLAEGFGEGIRVVRNEKNLGPAGARNGALAAARGELVAFLDADDYWLPTYLEEQIAFYEAAEAERPGVGIVSCDALIVDGEGNTIGAYRDRFPWPREPTLARLLVSNTIHALALAPRAVVEEAGAFDLECFGTEDHDLWIKVMELGYRPISNPRPLVAYRQEPGSGSVSSNAARMARNQQTVYRLALERGRLSRRERRIARRELRLHRLVEQLREIQSERADGGRLPLGRTLRAIPRGIAVALTNPQPWARLFKGSGGVRDRLMPGRDAQLG